MAIETPVRPDVVPPRSTDPTKKRAKRFGAITGALFGFFALGIAFAFFLSDLPIGNNNADGGTLKVTQSGLPLTAQDLFPTSASDGGTAAHESAFTLANENPVAVGYSMTAECDRINCAGTDQAAQWEDLYISIKEGERTIYHGRLADMKTGGKSQYPDNPLMKTGGPVDFGTLSPGAAKDYVARVWLKESGKVQPQDVINTWTFNLSAQTKG